MKKNRVLWQIIILVLAATFSSCGDKESADTIPHSLYAIARQSASAPLQYKAEMPVFSLNDIRSFNTKTGEIIFNDLTFDKHLFYDSSCQYNVYFYDEHGRTRSAIRCPCRILAFQRRLFRPADIPMRFLWTRRPIADYE